MVARKAGGLVGGQLFFTALKDIPSPCKAILASSEGLQKDCVGAPLEAFPTLQRGEPIPRGTLDVPCPDDGIVEPDRTIRSFGGAVMAFGSCSGPGFVAGDSRFGSALPSIPQLLVFLSN